MSKSAIALIKINIRFIKKNGTCFFYRFTIKTTIKALASLLLVIVAYTKIVKTAKVVVLILQLLTQDYHQQTLKTSLIKLVEGFK